MLSLRAGFDLEAAVVHLTCKIFIQAVIDKDTHCLSNN